MSLDGESWIEVGRVAIGLGSSVRAGVAASGADREPTRSFVAPLMEVCDAAVRAFDPEAEPEALHPDPLWLSDIVAGGDGSEPPPLFREEQDFAGLDIDTGDFRLEPDNRETLDLDGVNPSPVDDSDYVDSVFFIDEANNRDGFPINSEEATYRFPPEDVVGKSWNHILSNWTHDLSSPMASAWGIGRTSSRASASSHRPE